MASKKQLASYDQTIPEQYVTDPDSLFFICKFLKGIHAFFSKNRGSEFPERDIVKLSSNNTIDYIEMITPVPFGRFYGQLFPVNGYTGLFYEWAKANLNSENHIELQLPLIAEIQKLTKKACRECTITNKSFEIVADIDEETVIRFKILIEDGGISNTVPTQKVSTELSVDDVNTITYKDPATSDLILSIFGKDLLAINKGLEKLSLYYEKTDLISDGYAITLTGSNLTSVKNQIIAVNQFYTTIIQ